MLFGVEEVGGSSALLEHEVCGAAPRLVWTVTYSAVKAVKLPAAAFIDIIMDIILATYIHI